MDSNEPALACVDNTGYVCAFVCVRACKYGILHHGSHLEVGAQTVHFLLGMLLFKFKLLCGILQAHHILGHARILELQLAKAQRSGE